MKNKKIIIIILCFCVMFSLLSGCEKPKQNSSTETNLHQKDEIILIERYTNYAWTPQDHGHFLTADGKVWKFNFDDKKFNDIADFVDELNNIVKTQSHVKTIKDSHLEQIKDCTNKIEIGEAEPHFRGNACDMGETFIFIKKGNDFISVCGYGDNIIYYEVDGVKELADICIKEGWLSSGFTFEN